MTNYIYCTDNDPTNLCLRYNDRGWFTEPSPNEIYCLANGKPKGWSWKNHANDFEFKVVLPMVMILNEKEKK